MKLTLWKIHLFSLLTCTYVHGYSPDYISHAYTKYMQSFGTKDHPEPIEKPIDYTNPVELIKLLFKPSTFEVQELSNHEKRNLVIKTAPLIVSHETIIDSHVIDKMDLVYGGEKPSNNLMSFLSNSYAYFSLELGRKRFVELLSQPESDIITLTKRQKCIRELVDNKHLYQECLDTLQALKGTPESHLLSFFKEVNPIVKDLFPRVYFDSFVTRPFNNSPKMLEVGTRLSNAGTVFGVTFFPTFALGCLALRNVVLRDINSISDRLRYDISIGYIAVSSPFVSLPALSSARINKNICNYMQGYLIGLATCFREAEHISELIQRNPALRGCPEFDALHALTDARVHSSEFIELVNLLKTETFKGEASFFSFTGRVLRAYKIATMKPVQEEMASFLNALGEIDVYVALATLVKESQHNPNTYSFARFINADKPYVKAVNLWNPFVKPEYAVANTITMGTSGVYNIILTGPNTGGKSTLLKAFMINMLLAQTFGLAAASELTITPFNKLSCLLNITDDTAGGISLFKAEINRAQELITMVRSLRKNEFAFIIIDEIFTGTAPDKAAELAFKFIKQLADFDNCLFIDATHYKKLNELAQETPRCSNYHMGAIVNAEGNVEKYTYTLETGPSKINNALQIAQEEGIFN